MFNTINFVISFGAIQGLIIGIFLLIKGCKTKQEIYYLALTLIGFSAILGRVIFIGIYENKSWFFINLNFILLISPSFYLYAKESSTAANRPLRFNYQSFIPFLIVNLGYIIFYYVLNDSINYQIYLHNLIGANEGFSIIYFTVYLYFSYNTIKQNKNTDTSHKLLTQLLFIFSTFLLIWLFYVLAEWIYFNYNLELMFYYPMMILLAVILYYLSLKVVIDSQLLFDLKVITKRKIIILEEADSKKILDQLTLYMNDEKPFLDWGLSLISLANAININPKTLSFLLNEHLQKNFNDYINEWRIEEVKKMLNDKAYAHFKMLSIAFECGFNSKSTFNLAFKKATGLSPSEYRKT